MVVMKEDIYTHRYPDTEGITHMQNNMGKEKGWLGVRRWKRRVWPRGFGGFSWKGISEAGTTRGNIDWNRPLWPGTIVTICLSILQQEILVSNTELTSHHQPEDSGKVQRRCHMSYQPLRTLLFGIYLDQAMCVPPGKTLSQNDWPETT